MIKLWFLLLTVVGLVKGVCADVAPAATRWNVMDSGAVADGQADCTAVFQRLLDDAWQAGGGVVDVPAGRYAIKGNLKIPAGVTLQGIYRVLPTVQRNRQTRELAGSVLLAYAGRGQEQGEPFKIGRAHV